jgi:hypothetical protein
MDARTAVQAGPPVTQRTPAEELEQLAIESGFKLHTVAGMVDRFWLSQHGQMVFGGTFETCEMWLGGAASRLRV